MNPSDQGTIQVTVKGYIVAPDKPRTFTGERIAIVMLDNKKRFYFGSFQLETGNYTASLIKRAIIAKEKDMSLRRAARDDAQGPLGGQSFCRKWRSPWSRRICCC